MLKSRRPLCESVLCRLWSNVSSEEGLRVDLSVGVVMMVQECLPGNMEVTRVGEDFDFRDVRRDLFWFESSTASHCDDNIFMMDLDRSVGGGKTTPGW